MGFLKVWAPKAQKVDVLIQGTSISMSKKANSWWKVETSLAEHGSDYYFLLDNGQPFPDPRSHWQPKEEYTDLQELLIMKGLLGMTTPGNHLHCLQGLSMKCTWEHLVQKEHLKEQ